VIKVGLGDPSTGVGASIGKKGDVLVRSIGTPKFSSRIEAVPFIKFFETDAGSPDMLVDGSVTPVVFHLPAHQERDRYIKTIFITVVDAGAKLNEFGNLAALANGVLMEWETLGLAVEIGNFQTNFDMVRAAGGIPAFGSGTSAFLAANVISTSDAYLPMIDFALIFGMPWGLKLAAGTDQRMCVTIRDNVSTMDGFNMQARGFELLPE
jgi:hypothetical protein